MPLTSTVTMTFSCPYHSSGRHRTCRLKSSTLSTKFYTMKWILADMPSLLTLAPMVTWDLGKHRDRLTVRLV
jgi:hypothetical protein